VNCIVTHPADVPTKQKERLNKNDRIDAKKLARSLNHNQLQAIYIPDRVAEEYRYLARHRYHLIKDQTRFKNRISSTLYYFGIRVPFELEETRWSGKFLHWLSAIRFETEYARFAFDDQIQRLKQLRRDLALTLKTMKKMASLAARFSPYYGYLLSVPGIGPITAIALLTEIMDIHRFMRIDQLVCFVGLSPSVRSSDQRETQHGISPRRNKYLRSMLIEAAWIAIKKDPALTMKFGQLCQRMGKNKAIVHIAKMVLSRVRYVWKNQKTYVPGVVN
jgi:transposase